MNQWFKSEWSIILEKCDSVNTFIEDETGAAVKNLQLKLSPVCSTLCVFLTASLLKWLKSSEKHSEASK